MRSFMVTMWLGLCLLFVAFAMPACAASRTIPQPGLTHDEVKEATELKPVVVTPTPTPKPTPTPVVQKPPATVLAWGKGHPTWDKGLDDAKPLFKSITVNPKDAKVFCPAYNKLPTWERWNVIRHLVSIMTKYESGFNPLSKYTESFADSKGKKVVSRGLGQISIESANSYGCGFKNAEELHEPIKNLTCMVRILDRWMGRSEVFQGQLPVTEKYAKNGKLETRTVMKWRGSCSAYWAVCRDLKGKKSFPAIKAYMQALPVCKL